MLSDHIARCERIIPILRNRTQSLPWNGPTRWKSLNISIAEELHLQSRREQENERLRQQETRWIYEQASPTMAPDGEPVTTRTYDSEHRSIEHSELPIGRVLTWAECERDAILKEAGYDVQRARQRYDRVMEGVMTGMMIIFVVRRCSAQ